MTLLKVFVFVVVLGVAVAFSPGQYVPRSFYVIDQYGRQSEPVYIRSRRDIMNHPLFRVRRSDNYASSSSSAHASSSASSSAGGGSGSPHYYGGDYVPNVAHDPSGIFGQVQNLLNNIPTGGPSGGGAQSFASASSSSNAGSGGHGSGQSYGGLGAGHDAGYQGPVLFSRFGEAEGQGVEVSGAAKGEKGAFSSVSSSVNDGKIHYSVQSGKY